MRTMQISAYGGPENFEMMVERTPDIAEGELLIRNYASSVNPVDILVRSGKLRPLSGLTTPKMLGGDFAGKIVRSKHPDWQEGEEVFGMLSPLKGGAYAEYLKVDGDKVGKRPAHLTGRSRGVEHSLALGLPGTRRLW